MASPKQFDDLNDHCVSIIPKKTSKTTNIVFSTSKNGESSKNRLNPTINVRILSKNMSKIEF